MISIAELLQKRSSYLETMQLVERNNPSPVNSFICIELPSSHL